MEENDEIEAQRRYYAETAKQYDQLHVRDGDEHSLALEWLVEIVRGRGFLSVLDVGSGTGRAMIHLMKFCPEATITGVEPSDELRDIAYKRGLSQLDLVKGDATNLQFADGEFDVVCEFGILHHIRNPRLAIDEMIRVARKAIFISDDNHYAAGGRIGKVSKQILRSLGLWKTAYAIRTLGKGYRISESDGLSYPYSVFDDVVHMQGSCRSLRFMGTRNSASDLLRDAPHVALVGIKKL